MNLRVVSPSSSSISSRSLNVVNLPSVPVRRTLSEPGGLWRAAVISRLEQLIRLENGWDGYNGAPVAFENATFALQMLDAICEDETPVPQIVPGVSGDLQIEWHTDSGDIELHVIGPNDVYAWKWAEGDDDDGEEVALRNDFLIVTKWMTQVLEPKVAAQAAAA